MKPPPFRYHRPGSLDDALAVLAEVGGDGRVLAGLAEAAARAGSTAGSTPKEDRR